jgi:hypothetical protein
VSCDKEALSGAMVGLHGQVCLVSGEPDGLVAFKAVDASLEATAVEHNAAGFEEPWRGAIDLREELGLRDGVEAWGTVMLPVRILRQHDEVLPVPREAGELGLLALKRAAQGEEGDGLLWCIPP